MIEKEYKEKPKCAACEENGVKYKTFEDAILKECIERHAFWDEDGIYHDKMHIVVTERNYSCSHGHKWQVTTECSMKPILFI